MPRQLSAEDVVLVQQLREAAERFDMEAARGRGFAVGKGDVCRSIAERAARFGLFASARQRSYAESLVRWSRPRSEQPRRTDETLNLTAEARTAARDAARTTFMSSGSMQRIVQLFAAAAVHGLRFPKIRLQRGEWKISIYPASGIARRGSFYVKARSRTGRSLYCGRITPSGDFISTDNCPLDVLQALGDFSNDPAQVARTYGHATGSCCFCGHELTDGRSVAMGYGPICADHFGLPWGEERADQFVPLPVGASPIGAVRNMTQELHDVLERQRRAAARIQPRESPRHVGIDVGQPDQSRSLHFRHAGRRTEYRASELTEEQRRAMMPRPAPVAPVPPEEEDEDKHFM